jgi:hypothetical protein
MHACPIHGCPIHACPIHGCLMMSHAHAYPIHGWTVIANQIAKMISCPVRTPGGGGGTLMPYFAKAAMSEPDGLLQGIEELAELGAAGTCFLGFAVLHARTQMCDMHVRACLIRV